MPTRVERLCRLLAGLVSIGPAAAQPLLYAQRLPEGTVYVRLANALPAAAHVRTSFAGTVELGGEGAARISPYFVAGDAGGRSVSLEVVEAGRTSVAAFQPKSGAFVTVVLHSVPAGVTASVVTDRPEYNQLRARLSFYNATADCAAGSLVADGRPVFASVQVDAGQARAINPVAATVIAACAAGAAAPLDLGRLEAGGLYSVWLMRPAGQLVSFVAHDTIAPPRR